MLDVRAWMGSNPQWYRDETIVRAYKRVKELVSLEDSRFIHVRIMPDNLVSLRELVEDPYYGDREYVEYESAELLEAVQQLCQMLLNTLGLTSLIDTVTVEVNHWRI
jgi:protein-tyrosine-phosphatase